MSKVVFVLSVLGALAAAFAQDADESGPLSSPCGPNEHYEKNSSKCQFTCSNMHLEPVMAACAPTGTCYCNKNYVRDENGVCIPRKQCPSPPPSCGPNEHYETNTNNCDLSCDDIPIEPVIGICDTHSACTCDRGYLRNKDRICIRREQCPPPTPRCGPYEHYERNSYNCQITCATKDIPPGSCYSSGACYCDEGYVRRGNGDCIPREKCPSRTPVCGPNEVSTDCYNSCQRTCKNRIIGDDKACAQVCGTTGCICKPDYLRHDNGTCVPVDQCSAPDCRKGEVYNKCGSSCPETCETRGDTCKVCLAVCVDDCFCAPNTIRAPDGSCVPPEQCPPRTCGPNEIFDECPPTCPPTENCSNIWSRFNCSDPIDCCKPSCRCVPGYYRNDQNICVSTQECTSPPPSCGPNEHYETNTNNCDLSCDDIPIEPVIGICDTHSACTCDRGYLRNKDRICIRREQCPPPTPRCGPYEHYERNSYNCQITCATKDIPPGSCYSSGACYCDEGYVRRANGDCIPREKCPETGGQSQAEDNA